MSTYNSKQDSNQVFSISAISGTNSSTYGTAETIALTATDDGYLNVNAVVNVPPITISAIDTVGTIQNIAGGTINVGGTVPVSGTVVTSAANLPGGTIDLLKNGTVAVSSLPSATVSSGSIAVTAGTVNIAGTPTVELNSLGGVFKATPVAVSNATATPIPASPLASRKAFVIQNIGTSPLWLGGTEVGVGTGILVGTASSGSYKYSPSFDAGAAVIYGLAATAGGTAAILEVS